MSSDPTNTTKSSRADAAPAGNGSEHESPGQAAGDLPRHLAELQSHVRYFLSAWMDELKLSARNAVLYAILGVVALLVFCAIVVTAVVLLLGGLAGAASATFGAPGWVGNLIVGVLVLLLVAGGGFLGMSWYAKFSRAKTVHKYERKRQDQRSRFGRDVGDRAAR
jgi:hypothetical protein